MTDTQSSPDATGLSRSVPQQQLPTQVPRQRQHAEGYPAPTAMSPWPAPQPAPTTPPPPPAQPARAPRPTGALIIAGAILLVGIAALLVWVFVIRPTAPSAAVPSSTATSSAPSSAGTGGSYGTSYTDATADIRFVNALNSNGVPIADAGTRDSAIVAGHSVCDGLDRGVPVMQMANAIYQGTAFTSNQTGVIVGASVAAYCPRHLGQVSSR